MNIDIGRNATYKPEAKELVVSAHLKFGGKHVWPCDCGNTACTGHTAQREVIHAESIGDALHILITEPS
jgi:hypothetical protein